MHVAICMFTNWSNDECRLRWYQHQIGNFGLWHASSQLYPYIFVPSKIPPQLRSRHYWNVSVLTASLKDTYSYVNISFSFHQIFTSDQA